MYSDDCHNVEHAWTTFGVLGHSGLEGDNLLLQPKWNSNVNTLCSKQKLVNDFYAIIVEEAQRCTLKIGYSEII